ncbi:PREDICTED: uncharacterized protein LOC104812673 [Tarenaya hassleriana]|uniref:uncharacterized protein LOC104812673 n=1 Tax=Tarenaya hassleriana TaxID=28532 RepID=UPI00053C58BF|nr:PREDICTED: uncharacterized protein LOC104812673 [Tarenaya hassleriana]
MEIIYLLCSILCTSTTSLFLSIFLPFRVLLGRVSGSRAAATTLYEGTVWHDRLRPVRHSFRYSVRYALFDLDHAPDAPPDHLSADDARRVAHTTGPIFLLTIPPSVGYEQNPLSLYYCYDIEGSSRRLRKCIAQVTNTPWGERVTFVFNPESDLIAKSLQVSPFMDMLGNWKIRASDPGDDLHVSIEVLFFSSLVRSNPHTRIYTHIYIYATRVSDHAIFFWLMPHKVAIWIYWHALKLWWKNVSFIQHPRYSNPSYKEDAILRDQKLRCGGLDESDQDEIMEVDGFNAGSCGNFGACRFAWRDAKWPWS